MLGLFVSLAVRAEPTTTQGDKTTAITISTLLLLAAFIIVVLSREAIKFVVLRKFQFDDTLILTAAVSVFRPTETLHQLTAYIQVFAIGHSINGLLLASNGLGRSGPLTLSRADALQKVLSSSHIPLLHPTILTTGTGLICI